MNIMVNMVNNPLKLKYLLRIILSCLPGYTYPLVLKNPFKINARPCLEQT